VAGLETAGPKRVLSHGKVAKGARRVNGSGSLQAANAESSNLHRTLSEGKAIKSARRAKPSEDLAHVDPSKLNRASPHGKPRKGVRSI